MKVQWNYLIVSCISLMSFYIYSHLTCWKCHSVNSVLFTQCSNTFC